MTKPKILSLNCNRCGKCCVVYVKGAWYPCRYLRGTGRIKTCRVFASRLGRVVGEMQICSNRCEMPYDYPDCPNNKGYPIHPAYLNTKNP